MVINLLRGALIASLIGAAGGASAANPSMLDSFDYDKPALLHPLPNAAQKLVVQISDERPELWNLLLNNVQATQTALGRDKVQIVVVAYGPGLRMLFKDSAVAARIAAADAAGVEFDACNNTLQGMSKALGHTPELLDQSMIVPAGVVRIMQLQTHGYSYLRP